MVREKKALTCGNAESEEEMKERRHVSRKGPAGTRAQLWKWVEDKEVPMPASSVADLYHLTLIRIQDQKKILYGSGSRQKIIQFQEI